MHSLLLLVLVAGVLALPGIGASLATFSPGGVSVVTWSAAAFGLGYAASGGCALALSAAHAFRLDVYVPLWLAISAVLWIVALRRASFRDHARALRNDINNNRLPLVLGSLVVLAVIIVHLRFLYLLGGPRYIYYLNGLQIANSGGVPASTLEYGQSWPPATDKIFLDSFTGVAALLSHNVALGPGVFVWFATLGSALGLWATAWELGLRYTGGLLPLLMLNNKLILNTSLTTDFTDYRAEAFGCAVAFCALALGIFAIRERKLSYAAMAGVVLAAGSGTHLVPVLVVVIALSAVGVAELIRDHRTRARLVTLRQEIVLGAVFAFFAVAIRLMAGGTFGLAGATHPAGYAATHTSFDATAYLYDGTFLPWAPAGSGHWYLPPGDVAKIILAGSHITWPAWGLWLLVAGSLLAATLLFLLARTDLRIVGVVGMGVLAGIIAVSLAFAWRYHVYIDATFGVRRLRKSSSLALLLLGLGVLEGLLMLLRRSRPRLATGIAVAAVVSLTAWLVPSIGTRELDHLSQDRTRLINWMRTGTPCDARFLVNQRTEGTLAALAGRFALLEGMGPFLRVDKLPYVVDLMLSARSFFHAPLSHEEFLRRHEISYVIVARLGQLLGYQAPVGKTDIRALNAAPFLHRVLATPYVLIYQVVGARGQPISPLLTGPYLHCLKTPVHF